MLLVICNRSGECEMKETCKHGTPHKPTKIFHTTTQKSWCHILTGSCPAVNDSICVTHKTH